MRPIDNTRVCTKPTKREPRLRTFQLNTSDLPAAREVLGHTVLGRQLSFEIWEVDITEQVWRSLGIVTQNKISQIVIRQTIHY